MKDPTLDPEILDLAWEVGVQHICVVQNPNTSESTLRKAIAISGKKGRDPVGDTKGGELVCFMSYNLSLSGDMIDECTRVAKKTGTLTNLLLLKNVSGDTLERLSTHKTKSVRNLAIVRAFQLGFLKF